MIDQHYWAMFAAACISSPHAYVRTEAPMLADRMLNELKIRFPDPRRHEDHFAGTPISKLNDEQKAEFEEWKKRDIFSNQT